MLPETPLIPQLPPRAERFSPEDAIVIAYGSFGLDLQSQRIGVEAVITNDLRMATNFRTRLTVLERQFSQVIVRLPEPYRKSTLPMVTTPPEVPMDL